MKAVFLGNPPLGPAVLKRLGDVPDIDIVAVVTQTEPPRGSRTKSLPVAEYAAERGWKTVTPETPAELTQLVKDADPDVCIVAAYGRIVPEQALRLAGGRWLNVHSSLLPRYRGATPVQHAILDGLSETGVTIMEVSPGLDAGPVVAQAKVPVEPGDTTASLTERIAERGGDLLAEVLPDYLSGTLEPRPQDDAAASMTKPLTKDDGRIDWKRDGGHIERFVRAMQPWPGAWTETDGTRVEILGVSPAGPMDGSPGSFEGPPLRVMTGTDVLRIDRIKPAGKRAVPGDDWLRGWRGERRFA